MRIDRVILAMELKRRDMKYNQLADMAGLSRATVCSISGGKSVRPDTARKIADALSLPLERLLERSN
jgi:DNA-binding Xre family transcriptional regulator